jgi:mono/diheme cytochrome c family protein
MSRRRVRQELVWRNVIASRSPFLFGALFTAFAAHAEEATSPDWADVSAIFEERCVMCHSAVAGASKGLRLDDYDAVLAGGDDGPVLLPGDAAGSELMRRLRGERTPRMPFLSRPLPEDQIALIEAWIVTGMPNENGSR